FIMLPLPPHPSLNTHSLHDALPILYDLELTRNISLQMGPQIRLLQNNNSMMAEKIQSTIVNTIPLWKNQMVLALGLVHSQQAQRDRKSTRLNSSHVSISYAVFCLKK